MKIKEAYIKGLLKIGKRVSCNGDGNFKICFQYTGEIYAVDNTDINIKRDDNYIGLGRNGTWRVSILNPKTEIYFESEFHITILNQYTNTTYSGLYEGKKIYIVDKGNYAYTKGEYTVVGFMYNNMIVVS